MKLQMMNLPKPRQLETKILALDDLPDPLGVKQIYDPPLIFIYKGKPGGRISQQVGTGPRRHMAPAERISSDLASRGLVIFGLARGVDAVAHPGAVVKNRKYS
jgi:predicted Rossmann fold nucleotide-binding protein DprA/Smf involved in DNA uptake